jgi:hypothetical protein
MANPGIGVAQFGDPLGAVGSSETQNGGSMGGGGGGIVGVAAGAGGPGGIVVEWFY